MPIRLLMIFSVLSCFSLFNAACPAQVKIDWKTNIVGNWEVDGDATGKHLAEKLPDIHKEILSTLGFAPWDQLSVSRLIISKSEISFSSDYSPEKRYSYKFESLKAEQSFQITISIKDYPLLLRLTAINEKQFVVAIPVSNFGPIEVVYSKVKSVPTPDPTKLIREIKGKWILVPALTKSLLKEQVSGHVLSQYTSDLFKHLDEFEVLNIEDKLFRYEGEKSESLIERVSSIENGLVVHPRPNYSQTMQVKILDKNTLLVWDSARFIYAIYARQSHVKNDKKAKADPAGLPKIREAVLSIDYYRWPKREPLEERVDPIGISGAVELEEVEIERRRAASAVRYADISNTGLGFFLDLHGELIDSRSGGYLIQLTKLNDVIDDSGRVLSTKSRRMRNEILQKHIQSRVSGGKRDGRSGPTVYLGLNAPGLGATKLMEVSGEFSVRPFSKKWIKFDDLRSLVGKKLIHPLLEKQSVIPNINDEDFEIEIELDRNHMQRVVSWGVMDSNGKELEWSSVTGSGPPLAKGYSRRIPQKITLWIEVMKLQPEQKLPFKFTNIRFGDFQLK